LQTLILVVALGFAFAAAYGIACVLLPSNRQDPLTLGVTTLGLSLGLLTLVMFWVGFLWPGRLNLATTVGTCAIPAAAGLWLARKQGIAGDRSADATGPATQWDPLSLALVAAIALISVGVLFNAVYWPFVDADALAIYAPLAKRIFESGDLPLGTLYEGYPMLVPLAYAYTHWAAGGVNEYVARLVPAVMALGAAGAAGALGKELRSSRVGLWAAGLVVLTPLFGRWASSGYVDVPASFYFALTALTAWRWLRSQSWQDAVLTGIFSGLAMWTKSDALTLGVSIALLVALRSCQGRRDEAAALRWPQVALIAAGMLGVAAPWYLRNILVLGFFLPDTAWTSLAQRNFGSLTVMLRDRQDFLASGWLFSASLLYAGARTIVEGLRRITVWNFLLALALPFLGAWWWWASYDVRFLVTVVPVMSVAGASMLEDAAAHLGSPEARRRIAWVGALAVLILTPFALQKTVEGKWAILRDPWMSDSEKHRERLGGLYDLALEINRLPVGSRVVGVPSLSLYHIDTARFSELSQAMPDGAPWDFSPAYDYAIYSFRGEDKPSWFSAATPMSTTDDGYYLYSTRPADAL
jgi:hypothetical protein